jgi:anti-sigma B factor antagonist
MARHRPSEGRINLREQSSPVFNSLASVFGTEGYSMGMTISERRLDGVVIMDLTGRITIGEGTVVLRKRIQELLDQDEKQLLLNLADVDYIDSSGLGEVVRAYTTVRNAGGNLKLLSLTAKVRDLMQITKLLTVLDVFERESEALKSYR